MVNSTTRIMTVIGVACCAICQTLIQPLPFCLCSLPRYPTYATQGPIQPQTFCASCWYSSLNPPQLRLVKLRFLEESCFPISGKLIFSICLRSTWDDRGMSGPLQRSESDILNQGRVSRIGWSLPHAEGWYPVIPHLHRLWLLLHGRDLHPVL